MLGENSRATADLSTPLIAAGIGKRATFGFLYYVFIIRNLNKVYIHSRDINMRNINLNGRFGFELEGVFLDDIKVGDRSLGHRANGFVQAALVTDFFSPRPGARERSSVTLQISANAPFS
jgi:hypothetical protein